MPGRGSNNDYLEGEIDTDSASGNYVSFGAIDPRDENGDGPDDGCFSIDWSEMGSADDLLAQLEKAVEVVKKYKDTCYFQLHTD